MDIPRRQDTVMQDAKSASNRGWVSTLSPSSPTAPASPMTGLGRLRIGSSGESANPRPTYSDLLAMSPTTAPSPIAMGIPSTQPRSTQMEPTFSNFSDSSDKNLNVHPGSSGAWSSSPAADFLASFSPPSHAAHPYFGSIAGDQAGFEIEGYKLGYELGSGGFGVVREAVRASDGEKVAVKIVRHAAAVEEELPASSFMVTTDSLRRSGSGIRLGNRRPGNQLNNDRARSFSSPAPPNLLHQQLQRSRPISTIGNSLSSSLSSIPSAPTPEPLLTAPPSPTLLQSLLEREINLWQQLSPHPHIVPLLAVHHTTVFSYIFMPLCEGGNLLTYLNSRGRGRERRQRSSLVVGLRSTEEEDAEDVSGQGGGPRRRGLQSLSACLPIFAQIVQGLHYLHTEAGVTHKDIKLENILCDERGGTCWKIADFGLAETGLKEEEVSNLNLSPNGVASGSVTPGTPLSSLSRASSLSRPSLSSQSIQNHLHPAGSLPYTTPEQMRSPTPILDPSVDIWALGCILYALIEGRLPFEDEFEPRLRMKIMSGEWVIPEVLQPRQNQRGRSERGTSSIGDKVGMETRSGKEREELEKKWILEVLQGCLALDPTKRWTIERIRSSDWLLSDSTTTNRGRGRGRSLLSRSSNPSTTRESSTNSSRSTSARRKERSTSRGPLAHCGVDPRTRENERGRMEKGDRKLRWERERTGSRSASRGKLREESSGSSSGALGSERLGRVAEPY